MIAAIASVNVAPALPFIQPGAVADQTAVKAPCGRRKNGAEMRGAVDDQADVDRVIVPAANEFLRPIERVDQKVSIAMRRDSASGDFLRASR